MQDLATVAGILRDEHGWDDLRMIERLKSTDQMLLLTALRQLDVPQPRSRPITKLVRKMTFRWVGSACPESVFPSLGDEGRKAISGRRILRADHARRQSAA